MAKVSLHNHTTYSDGAFSVAEMASAAYEAGYTHLGISDHVCNPSYTWLGMDPSVYPRYVEDINEQKERFRGRMHVYASIETDYYHNSPYPPEGESKVGELRPHLDYLVGSMHFLTPDGSRCLSENKASNLPETASLCYGGDIKTLVEDYYKTYINMLRHYRPAMCAHLDIVKLNNQATPLFDENAPWYGALVDEALLEIKALGVVLELNYGPISRYGGDFVYPSKPILQKAKALDVPVTLSADAHHTLSLTDQYTTAVSILRDCGYTQVWVPGETPDTPWHPEEIDD